MLRKRYGHFLGSTYIPDDVYARSTDYDRTKMTLQLVLAGLYPPNALQQWKYDLNWQPIPAHYVPEPQDELFQRIYICDSHIKEQERVKKMPHITQSLARFDVIKKEMTYLTGWNMTDIFDLYTLYCNIICLDSMHWKVPDWSRSAMPVLEDSTLESFKIMNYNEVLRRQNGGALVRKISEEMSAVRNVTVEKKRKIFLYSSHDINVYAVLAALKVVKPHLPEFTSAAILELLSINGNYYVKVLHYLGIPAVMEELQIPNCSSPCPLDTFFELIKNVIPSDEELKCS
ncbi:venom acid phosphatase Acph-1-like [Belonocnema kinseyi]|uniref:venom acid phosphatase Acph-1-like n=1 Tax=Belonocnema kinseyi TaxID=2817044 RepID=UPI00143CC7AC|nr:venom acid phosphatase Acph-1-like [Belonocnema kinseyi]